MSTKIKLNKKLSESLHMIYEDDAVDASAANSSGASEQDAAREKEIARINNIIVALNELVNSIANNESMKTIANNIGDSVNDYYDQLTKTKITNDTIGDNIVAFAKNFLGFLQCIIVSIQNSSIGNDQNGQENGGQANGASDNGGQGNGEQGSGEQGNGAVNQ